MVHVVLYDSQGFIPQSSPWNMFASNIFVFNQFLCTRQCRSNKCLMNSYPWTRRSNWTLWNRKLIYWNRCVSWGSKVWDLLQATGGASFRLIGRQCCEVVQSPLDGLRDGRWSGQVGTLRLKPVLVRQIGEFDLESFRGGVGGWTLGHLRLGLGVPRVLQESVLLRDNPVASLKAVTRNGSSDYFWGLFINSFNIETLERQVVGWWICNNVQRSGRGINEVLTRILQGGTGENKESPQSC